MPKGFKLILIVLALAYYVEYGQTQVILTLESLAHCVLGG